MSVSAGAGAALGTDGRAHQPPTAFTFAALNSLGPWGRIVLGLTPGCNRITPNITKTSPAVLPGVWYPRCVGSTERLHCAKEVGEGKYRNHTQQISAYLIQLSVEV